MKLFRREKKTEKKVGEKFTHYLRAGTGYDHGQRKVVGAYDIFHYRCRELVVYFSSKKKPSKESEKVTFIEFLYRTPYEKRDRLLTTSDKVTVNIKTLKALPIFWQYSKFIPKGEFFSAGIYTIRQVYGKKIIASRSLVVEDERTMTFSKTKDKVNNQVIFNKDNTPVFYFQWNSHMLFKKDPKIVLRLMKKTENGFPNHRDGSIVSNLAVKAPSTGFSKLKCSFYPPNIPQGFYEVQVHVALPFQRGKFRLLEKASIQLVNSRAYRGDAYVQPIIVGKSLPFVQISGLQRQLPTQNQPQQRNPQTNISSKLVEPTAPAFNPNERLEYIQPVVFPQPQPHQQQFGSPKPTVLEPSAPDFFDENAKMQEYEPPREHENKNEEVIGHDDVVEEEEDENNSCCVCFEPIVQKVALIPCGHGKTCEKCLLGMKQRNQYNCPICRSPITSVLKIYL